MLSFLQQNLVEQSGWLKALKFLEYTQDIREGAFEEYAARLWEVMVVAFSENTHRRHGWETFPASHPSPSLSSSSPPQPSGMTPSQGGVHKGGDRGHSGTRGGSGGVGGPRTWDELRGRGGM